MKSFSFSAFIFTILFVSFMCHGGIGNNNYNLIPIAGEARIYGDIAKYNSTLGLFNIEGEAIIFGRIARSEKNGILSDAGLLGACESKGLKGYEKYEQQLACYRDVNCHRYLIYESQSGGQALIYSLINKLYKDPIIFRALCASFLSAVLVSWFCWLGEYFGLFSSLWIMFGILFFRSLFLFGDNIAQVLGADYLIMVALFWAYKKKMENVGEITFFVVLLKLLLNGAEYLFSALLLPFLPLVFYAVLDKMSKQSIRRDVLLISGGIGLACLVSFLILSIQVSITASPAEAMHHFMNRLMARTYSPDLLAFPFKNFTKNISIIQLLHLYLSMPCVCIGSFQISFMMMIVFFFMISILAFYLYRCYQERILLALLATTWASILCPLSWILMAKGHSATHTFIDQWIWHLPFTLFGMALTVVTLQMCSKFFYKFRINSAA